MIKINKSPILTSKNYGVNYFEVEEKDLQASSNSKPLTDLVNISVENCECKEMELKDVPQIVISEKLEAQVKNQSNFIKNFVIEKDSNKPLIVSFNDNIGLIGAVRVRVKEDVYASVIIKLNSHNVSYNNIVITLDVCENANLNLMFVSDINSQSNSYVSVIGNCDTNSQLNLSIVDFGCKNTAQNVSVNLNNELSRFNLNSIYFGGKTERLSLNYLSNVYGPKSNTNIDVCGVLTGNATKNFLGTIDFKTGCAKSKGNVNEHGILLSDNVKANSTPILLSTEEDVDGSHSASVGKIEDDELFYIMSRGIPKQDAIKLLVKAKLVKLTNDVLDDNLKLQIYKRIEEKIDEENWRYI